MNGVKVPSQDKVADISVCEFVDFQFANADEPPAAPNQPPIFFLREAEGFASSSLHVRINTDLSWSGLSRLTRTSTLLEPMLRKEGQGSAVGVGGHTGAEAYVLGMMAPCGDHLEDSKEEAVPIG